jgi:translation initiation factor IF-3
VAWLKRYGWEPAALDLSQTARGGPVCSPCGAFCVPHGRHAVPGQDRPGWDESDTGGHISTELRINERIRVPEVRLVGPSGEQVGIVSITDALRLAQEADLDLVEVAPTARPPVCKLMDYGKFKYESALKARESRKNQAQTVIKEIKIRPKIDPHDYGTKKGHVERFLKQGDKVKVTIMFRGREQSRPELGYKLLQRLAGDVEELGFVESQPKQDGRNMIMVIGPHRKKAETKAVRGPDRASARATASTAHVSHNDARQGAASVASTPQSAPVTRPEQADAVGDAESASAGPAGASAETRAEAPRPSPASAGGPRPAAPRPTAPKPGPAGNAPKPTAPAPGPAVGGAARPATPRPTAPKPGPVAASSPRPAPRPSAPRASAAKPAEGNGVPPPRTKSGESGSGQADTGG